MTRRCAWMLGVAFVVSAQAVWAVDSTIETVTVTGQAINADVKGRTPLIETPQNIQLLSSDLIDAQSITRLDEALRNVAGVMGGGYYTSYDYFRIRGFDASGSIYLDGMRLDSYVDVNAELAGLEQVQVVKGPAAAMYGQGTLGGLVNFVSKRPTDTAFAKIEGSYGSFGSYGVTADANTPIGADTSGRIVAVLRHTGSFVDDAKGDDRLYVAPSFSWTIDADTTLTLLGSYQHDRMNMMMPLTSVGTITPSQYGTYSLSINTSNKGDTNHSKTDRSTIGYQFEHSFDEVFTLSHRLRYTVNDQRWTNILYTSSLSDDGRYLSRYPYNYDSYGSMLSTDTAMTARFDTGAVHHQFMVGSDYYISRARSHSAQIDYSDPDSYMVLDLYAPSYGQALPDYTAFTAAREHAYDLGFYVQDHLRWGGWTATGSLRWDGAQTWDGTTKKNDVAITPRLGLTYDIRPGIAAFASYSESFQPQSGTRYTGEMLKPERGRQWETGIKSTLMDGKIDLTASLYYLTRNNVVTDDPDHRYFYLQSGKQRSRGFEFDSRFQLTERWQSILTYAYTDAAVVRDNTYPTGDQLSNVPLNSVGMWSRYAFDGMLNGFAATFGVYHYSSMAGDLPNSFRLPGYTLANTSFSYDYGPGEIEVSIKNLFNTRYFSGSYNAVYVQPGTPRNVQIRLKLGL